MKRIFLYALGYMILGISLSIGCHSNDSQQGQPEKSPAGSPVSAPLQSGLEKDAEPVPPEQMAAAEEALRQSSLDGQLQQVEAFLNGGIGPDVSDSEGHTPLMLAAFNGHGAIVLALLSRGAEVDRKDLMGRTALLYASTGPFPETVKILLDKGADPNLVDTGEHFTPLMHAAAEGNIEVVRILLEAGANPALRDVDNDNAETFARQAGHTEVADLIRNYR